MLWLLDTNVVSDRWKPRPNSGLGAWLAENEEDCAVSEITFGELYYGLHRLPYGKRRAKLESRIKFLRDEYRGLVLPFGASESYAWGEYAAQVFADRGKKFWNAQTIRDSALAATARAWSLVVVTRDTGHFPFVETLNPFAS